MGRSLRQLTDKDREKARERIARADARIKEDLKKIRATKPEKEPHEDGAYSWGTIWTKGDVMSRWRERHELGGLL